MTFQRAGRACLPAMFAAACATLIATTAAATVIGGTITTGPAGASFVKLTTPLANPFGPPNSVGNNTFQSNDFYAFDEDQAIVLGAPLTVDIVAAGAPGLSLASHYVFFDPATAQSIDATVDFDADIVAIITSTDNLLASDFLANTGVTYLNPAARGLEAGDSVTISGLRQIRFDTTAATPGDYVRVLTALPSTAVPEPMTLTLLGASVVGLIGVRRRTG